MVLRLSSDTVVDPSLLAGWDKPFALEMRLAFCVFIHYFCPIMIRRVLFACL